MTGTNGVREPFVSSAISDAAATLRVDRLAAETVHAFDSVAVPSILLKGASFARLFYPAGGRCYGDVDLLVRAADVATATEALQRCGFRPLDEGTPVIDRDADARTFGRRNADGFPDCVDLHWNLHQIRVEPERTWSALARRTTSLTLGGTTVRALDTVGCALHVALHAAQHGLRGPEPHNRGGRTGADLRRALRMLVLTDWVKAAELATELGIEDAFALGLRLEPEGARLSEQLDLTTAVPEAWRFAGTQPTRGAGRINRVLVAASWRERAALLRPVVCHGRVRVVREARSRLGRRVVAAAYLEYWVRLAAGLPAAVRDGRPRAERNG